MRYFVLRFLVSLVLGFAIGVLFHFALYRIAMPIEPFIYMAF